MKNENCFQKHIEFQGKKEEIIENSHKILGHLRRLNGAETLRKNELYFPKELKWF